MLKPLIAMIAVGTIVGLALPTGERPAEAIAVDDGQRRETLLEREGNGHFYVHAKVNGELVRFIVDTGATGVALTMEDAKRIGIAFSPAEFAYVGEGASGPVQGKLVTIDEIEIDGKRVENVSGAILKGIGPVATRAILSVANGRGADARRLYGAALSCLPR